VKNKKDGNPTKPASRAGRNQIVIDLTDEEASLFSAAAHYQYNGDLAAWVRRWGRENAAADLSELYESATKAEGRAA